MHINTSMFIPQTNEIDLLNFTGRQSDDINSLVEYVNQEILDNPDHSPEDEDNDHPRDYGFVQIDYYYNPEREITTNFLEIAAKNFFPEYSAGHMSSVCYDISAPPPKA